MIVVVAEKEGGSAGSRLIEATMRRMAEFPVSATYSVHVKAAAALALPSQAMPVGDEKSAAEPAPLLAAEPACAREPPPPATAKLAPASM
jgi:hypothetical protein